MDFDRRIEAFDCLAYLLRNGGTDTLPLSWEARQEILQFSHEVSEDELLALRQCCAAQTLQGRAV